MWCISCGGFCERLRGLLHFLRHSINFRTGYHRKEGRRAVLGTTAGGRLLSDDYGFYRFLNE